MRDAQKGMYRMNERREIKTQMFSHIEMSQQKTDDCYKYTNTNVQWSRVGSFLKTIPMRLNKIHYFSVNITEIKRLTRLK